MFDKIKRFLTIDIVLKGHVHLFSVKSGCTSSVSLKQSWYTVCCICFRPAAAQKLVQEGIMNIDGK